MGIGPIAQLVRARSLYLRCPWFESRSAHIDDKMIRMTKKKAKKLQDRIVRSSSVTGEQVDMVQNKSWPQEMMINGDMDLGKHGNPVTILIEDEVTGEQLEISGVKNAFLIVEDSRKKVSGWLALAIGSMDKMNAVLGFLSQSTLEALKRFTGR